MEGWWPEPLSEASGGKPLTRVERTFRYTFMRASSNEAAYAVAGGSFPKIN